MRRKNSRFRFTGKKRSRRGMYACLIAFVSIAVLGILLLESFDKLGVGSVYLGNIGFLGMILAVWALILAIGSLREENTFREIPIVSTVVSTIASLAWIGIYVMGCLA